MITEDGIEVLPGDVVQVADGRKKYGVFVIRTFTDGEFRGIPDSMLAYQAAGWKLAGRIDELVRNRTELENASKLYQAGIVVQKMDPNKFAVRQFHRDRKADTESKRQPHRKRNAITLRNARDLKQQLQTQFA